MSCQPLRGVVEPIGVLNHFMASFISQWNQFYNFYILNSKFNPDSDHLTFICHFLKVSSQVQN